MKWVELDVVEVKESLTLEVYDLIFFEKDGDYVIVIPIGQSEAKNILVLLNGIEIKRPSTYALLKTIADSQEMQLQQVVISRYENGVYCSDIMMKCGEKEIVFDSRTSDAVALAVLYNAPIYIDEELLLSHGGVRVEYCPPDSEEERKPEYEMLDSVENQLASMDVDELIKLLEQAINNEDFEFAALLQRYIDIKMD